MHIISKRKVDEFIIKYPDSKNPLLDWYRIIKNRGWENFAELRTIFPSADLVERRIVFNIGGNKYRLIARINFLYKKVFILHILTHANYDKGNWKR